MIVIAQPSDQTAKTEQTQQDHQNHDKDKKNRYGKHFVLLSLAIDLSNFVIVIL
jgi:hypothetical protein